MPKNGDGAETPTSSAGTIGQGTWTRFTQDVRRAYESMTTSEALRRAESSLEQCRAAKRGEH